MRTAGRKPPTMFLPQAFDFIIYNDGGEVAVKSGSTGRVVFKSPRYEEAVNFAMQKLEKGTIKVVGEFTQTGTITVKSGVTLDLTDAKITIASDVDGYFIERNGRLVGGEITIGVSNYSKTVIKLHGSQQYGTVKHNTTVRDTRIVNSETSGVAVGLYCDGEKQYIGWTTFDNLEIEGFEYAVLIKLTNQEDAWINGNIFENIKITGSKYGVWLERNKNLSYTKSACNNNFFDNIEYQAGSSTEVVFHVEGVGNFIKAKVWDLHSSPDALAFELTEDSSSTLIVTNTRRWIKDDGSHNTIITNDTSESLNVVSNEIVLSRSYKADSNNDHVMSPFLSFATTYYDGTETRTAKFGIVADSTPSGWFALQFRNLMTGKAVMYISSDGDLTVYKRISPALDGVVDLGLSTLRFRNGYFSGGIYHDGNLYWKGRAWVKFKEGPAGGTAGKCVYIGGGQVTVIGAGEAIDRAYDNITSMTEILYLVSDADVKVITNIQPGWESRVENAVFGADGVNKFTHVAPSQDNTYDLGSSVLRWRNLYTARAVIDSGGFGVELQGYNNAGYINAYPKIDADIPLKLSARRQTGTGGASDVVVLEPGGHFRPSVDGSYDLGKPTYRWRTLYAVNTQVGDVIFENKWRITEYDDNGKMINGLRILNDKGEEIFRITEDGLYFKGKKIA